MATDSQIVDSIKRRKRSSRRPWLIFAIAILLVTVPVLPLKFLGIPGPDFSTVTNLGTSVFNNLKGFPGRKKSTAKGQKDKTISPSAMQSVDVKLLDKTAQVLLRRISDNPNDPSLHNRLGLTLMELGENHASVTHFEQAVKLAKTKISDLKAKSNKAKKEKDLSTAAEYMTEISSLEVQLAASHSSLARIYERLGKSDKVIFHLNELDNEVALSNSFAPSRKKLLSKGMDDGTRLNATTASLLARANAFKEAGRLQDSIKEYQRLINKAPKLSVAHLELGLVASQAHNYWLAENELKETIRLNPNSATAHNALGEVYSITQRTDEAITQYTKAVALNPKATNASFNLGNMYASKGHYEEAREAFRQAAEHNPDSAYAHNNLATMASFLGDYDHAIQEFRETIRLSPNMASAHYGLGIALMNKKQYKASIPSFRSALALNPNLIDAHNKIEIAKRKRNSL